MNIEKKLEEIKNQICELDDRVADLEHRDEGITVYEALYLLNNATLERDLKSLMERIKELVIKLGRIEITICDTP